MLDDDDEVRDRASFYHYVLSSNDDVLIKSYILNDELQLSIVGLERALLAYTASTNSGNLVKPFDLLSVPMEEPKLGSEVTAIADSSTAGFFDSSKTAEKGICFFFE